MKTNSISNLYLAHKGNLKREQVPAGLFFPSSVKRLTAAINAVHRIHPVSAYRATMKVLSFSIKRTPNSEQSQFYKKGIRKKYRYQNKSFYTYAYGNGPTILMLHGFASLGARWRHQAEQLVRSGYRVVVMDAPGHGTSPGFLMSVPEYIDCVSLVIKDLHSLYGMMCHSMGCLAGVIALSFSGLQPLPERLVLMSSFSSCDRLMSRFARMIGFNEEVLQGTKKWILDYTGRPLCDYSLIDHLRRLSIRNVLLVHDSEDPVAPIEEFYRIQNSGVLHTSIQTQGIGHNLKSKDVIAKVIGFLDQKEPQKPSKMVAT